MAKPRHNRSAREWPATKIEYADEFLDRIEQTKPKDTFSAGGLIYRRAELAEPKIGNLLSLLNGQVVSVRPRLPDEGAVPETQE